MSCLWLPFLTAGRHLGPTPPPHDQACHLQELDQPQTTDGTIACTEKTETMDGLSAAASIIGVLQVTIQLSGIFASLLSKYKDAPKIFSDAKAEVEALGAIVQQSQDVLLLKVRVTQERGTMIWADQIVVTLATLVACLSDLNMIVDGIEEELKLSVVERVKLATKVNSIDSCLKKLQIQKLSLSLTLTVLTCDSFIRAEEASRELGPLMDRMLEGQDRILQRMDGLNQRLGGLDQRMENVENTHSVLERNLYSIIRPGFARPTTLYEMKALPASKAAAPFERPATSYEMKALPASEPAAPSDVIVHASTDPIPASHNYNWVEDLHNSWVYQKTVRKLEKGRPFSIFTSESKKTGSWSMLSGLNLYQVSNRSVLSLPIFAEDLSNADAYQFGKISTARVLGSALLRSTVVEGLARKRMLVGAGLAKATLKLKAVVRVDETEVDEDAELRAAWSVPYRLV